MRFLGQKWLKENYLTDATRKLAVALVANAKQEHPNERVCLRPSAYTGEGGPLLTVDVGGRIYRMIYQTDSRSFAR